MSNESVAEELAISPLAESDSLLNVVVLGTGQIGQTFLGLLQDKRVVSRLQDRYQLVAVANSRFYQFNPDGIAPSQLAQLEHQHFDNSTGQIYNLLDSLKAEKVVIIDLTASARVADHYLRFANKGWHIISANKIAAANHDYAQLIDSVLKSRQAQWLQNTTVGAALPIQDAIEKINQSGDQVHRVSGVFSGSISWLFGQYDGSQAFMDLVKTAHEKALTEPDPRDDLSGQDVYRKALILARTCGFKPKKITFNPVLPERYLTGELDSFWQQASTVNDFLSQRFKNIQADQKLQYLAQVDADEIVIDLVAIDCDHEAASLKPGDNIFIVESDCYKSNPLVMQGPGAGKEVTAAGVLTDLNQLLFNS